MPTDRRASCCCRLLLNQWMVKTEIPLYKSRLQKKSHFWTGDRGKMFKELGVLCAITVMLVGCGGIVGGANNIGGGGTTLGALNGQYAFSLAGFDPTGNPMSIAGSIQADGLGHITAGEVDLNDNGAISSNSSLSGTYAFDSNIAAA